MATNGTENGEFSFAANASTNGGKGRHGLAMIQTHKKKGDEVCHDDSATPVKAQTIDELHSLQRKKSAPTTPIKGTQGGFAAVSEEERQKQQLQSIRQKERAAESKMKAAPPSPMSRSMAWMSLWLSSSSPLLPYKFRGCQRQKEEKRRGKM